MRRETERHQLIWSCTWPCREGGHARAETQEDKWCLLERQRIATRARDSGPLPECRAAVYLALHEQLFRHVRHRRAHPCSIDGGMKLPIAQSLKGKHVVMLGICQAAPAPRKPRSLVSLDPELAAPASSSDALSHGRPPARICHMPQPIDP